jgi:uncharacterized protein
MNGGCLSLILLPTLRCNADCEYCFENKSSDVMSLDQFRIILQKVTDYMNLMHVTDLTIYWQGGEVFTMEPKWFMRALEIIDKSSQSSGKNIENELQTNLIGYSKKWNRVLKEMFNNECGSSLDYPNLYRKVSGLPPDQFNKLWLRRYREAASEGIGVGVISLPNRATFKLGARQFYSYYTEEIGLGGFQVNVPFPGFSTDPSKTGLLIDIEECSIFACELIDVWMEQGYSHGGRISPYWGILNYFLTGSKSDLLCGTRHDCSREFFSIGPDGNVSQCDCWVASYPEYHFGNVFGCDGLAEIMNSNPRRLFSDRPVKLMEKSDCVECEYLAICHGGCAIRAYSTCGDLFVKDPYCEMYKAVFKRLQEAAVTLSRESGRPPHTQSSFHVDARHREKTEIACNL